MDGAVESGIPGWPKAQEGDGRGGRSPQKDEPGADPGVIRGVGSEGVVFGFAVVVCFRGDHDAFEEEVKPSFWREEGGVSEVVRRGNCPGLEQCRPLGLLTIYPCPRDIPNPTRMCHRMNILLQVRPRDIKMVK